jgi:hypothetical protein
MANISFSVPKKEYKYPIAWSPENTSVTKNGIGVHCIDNTSKCELHCSRYKLYFNSLEEAEEKLGCISELTKEDFVKYFTNHRHIIV